VEVDVVSSPQTQPDGVAFWFDPSCPFTWQTSRWLREVAEARGVPVDWRLMSLAVLNADQEVPEQWREHVARGAVAGRVFAAVRSAGGAEALGRFYTEVGARVHEQGGDLGPDVFREALTAVGLPAELAEDDEAQQAAVEASHAESQERVGAEAGSPITAFPGAPGFFGPIVTPAPTGEDALRLFDGLALVSAVPGFSELKGARGDLP
jgi:mycothiol-dependent nitroreductase-like protein